LKNSFSLIELIFTIVIIALIFTVIPKVMYSTNQTFEFILKENGIFNLMTKTIDIANHAWDENNTDSQDPQYNILITGNQNVLECNSNQNPPIRVGGFYSGDKYSRICPKKKIFLVLPLEDITVSHIGPDKDENSEEDYDDEDDFNNTTTNVTKNGQVRYKIYTTISYVKEWSKDNYDTTNKTLTYKFSTDEEKKSNIKYIKLTLYDVKYDQNISHAKYWSANIGEIQEIENEQW
jgi:hypothetical protein